MPGRILVIRGGALGDFILTLPAIRLLRDNFRDCALHILGYRHIAILAEDITPIPSGRLTMGRWPLLQSQGLSTRNCATTSQDFSRSSVISMIRMVSSKAGGAPVRGISLVRRRRSPEPACSLPACRTTGATRIEAAGSGSTNLSFEQDLAAAETFSPDLRDRSWPSIRVAEARERTGPWRVGSRCRRKFLRMRASVTC